MITRILGAFAAALFFLSNPIDAAVRYVDPSSVAAQDAGAGDAAHPYRTISYAMRVLQPGDTLNIAGGTYRESLIFRSVSWAGGPTVIKPATSTAQVLIKGSDIVTGWQSLGNGVFVKTGWTANSQQVFVDGIGLQQIGGQIFSSDPFVWPARINGTAADLVDDSFYFDAAGQALYIKLPLASLSGHTVEASVRKFVVFGDTVQNVTLQQLQFQHSNTTSDSQNGAITLIGDNLTLDSLTISYADGSGTDITGNNNIVRNSTSSHNGQLGMKMRGRSNKVLNNTTNFNNTRGFNKWWEAGGIKFVGNGGLQDSEVSGHTAIGNFGDGIWFDWMNNNNKIHDNLSAYNQGFGIQYEASQHGYIYNNTIFSNGQRGIFFPDSSNTVVAYNLIVQNGMEGIATIDDGRSASNAVLVPLANRVYGNIVAWSGKADIVLPAGLQSNVSDYNVIVQTAQPHFSLGWDPIVVGLANWRALSGQDIHTLSVASAISSSLTAAFQSGTATPDFTSLLAIASTVGVTPLSANVPSQTKAGPAWVAILSGTANGNTSGTAGVATRVDTVWVNDALPAGAIAIGDTDGWNWVSSNPAPFSGALAHRSALLKGQHQHYFYNATTTLTVGTGDTLFAYVYLDPVNPPGEIMLKWNDGTWEHRAYWGANLVALGVDATASRRFMGPLPATGTWVRLEVPAALVGLEGRVLNGMAFLLQNGRAIWDYAGKAAAGADTIPPSTPTESSASGITATAATLSWSAATDNVAVTGYTVFRNGVQIGTSAGTSFTDSGLTASTVYRYTVAASDAAGNKSAQSDALSVTTSAPPRVDTVWVNDALPAGAIAVGDADGWKWVSSNPGPFSGTLAHQSALLKGQHQHYFYNATTTLTVGTGDTLFAYVYLDPVNPPSEIMLKWNDGTWEHRAYWGPNLVALGADGTVSRRFMGPLPATGTWVRLEVPAALVGLEGRALNGMAFLLQNGRATWDYAGKAGLPR